MWNGTFRQEEFNSHVRVAIKLQLRSRPTVCLASRLEVKCWFGLYLVSTRPVEQNFYRLLKLVHWFKVYWRVAIFRDLKPAIYMHRVIWGVSDVTDRKRRHYSISRPWFPNNLQWMSTNSISNRLDVISAFHWTRIGEPSKSAARERAKPKMIYQIDFPIPISFG